MGTLSDQSEQVFMQKKRKSTGFDVVDHGRSVLSTLKVPFIGIGGTRKWRHSIRN